MGVLFLISKGEGGGQATTACIGGGGGYCTILDGMVYLYQKILPAPRRQGGGGDCVIKPALQGGGHEFPNTSQVRAIMYGKPSQD